VREEESAGVVIKLESIVSLDTLDFATKLGGHIGEEVRVLRRCQTYGVAERSTSSECNH
jgi:hypothetical protein